MASTYAGRSYYQGHSQTRSYAPRANGGTPRPVSDKQVAFLNSLMAQLGLDATVTDEQRAALTTQSASQLIDHFKTEVDKARQAAPAKAETPEGFHYVEGTYYQVQRSKTGNLYAKRFDGHEWIYEGKSPLRLLSTETVLTAEQAALFGHMTGHCVFCSRILTDERSVSVGYGPICAKKHGLPWG